MTSAPAPAPRPAPRPPGAHTPGSTGRELPDATALLPTAEELEQLPVREHVAVFEALQAALSDHLDDAD